MTAQDCVPCHSMMEAIFKENQCINLVILYMSSLKGVFYPLALKYEMEELKERVLFLEAELKRQEQR